MRSSFPGASVRLRTPAVDLAWRDAGAPGEFDFGARRCTPVHAGRAVNAVQDRA